MIWTYSLYNVNRERNIIITEIIILFALTVFFTVILPEITAYDYITEGTVVSVGENGIVVEYYNEYGERETSRIKSKKTDEYDEYKVGDTTTVHIRDNDIISDKYFKRIVMLE